MMSDESNCFNSMHELQLFCHQRLRFFSVLWRYLAIILFVNATSSFFSRLLCAQQTRKHHNARARCSYRRKLSNFCHTEAVKKSNGILQQNAVVRCFNAKLAADFTFFLFDYILLVMRKVVTCCRTLMLERRLDNPVYVRILRR